MPLPVAARSPDGTSPLPRSATLARGAAPPAGPSQMLGSATNCPEGRNEATPSLVMHFASSILWAFTEKQKVDDGFLAVFFFTALLN